MYTVQYAEIACVLIHSMIINYFCDIYIYIYISIYIYIHIYIYIYISVYTYVLCNL